MPAEVDDDCVILECYPPLSKSKDCGVQTDCSLLQAAKAWDRTLSRLPSIPDVIDIADDDDWPSSNPSLTSTCSVQTDPSMSAHPTPTPGQIADGEDTIPFLSPQASNLQPALTDGRHLSFVGVVGQVQVAPILNGCANNTSTNAGQLHLQSINNESGSLQRNAILDQTNLEGQIDVEGSEVASTLSVEDDVSTLSVSDDDRYEDFGSDCDSDMDDIRDIVHEKRERANGWSRLMPSDGVGPPPSDDDETDTEIEVEMAQDDLSSAPVDVSLNSAPVLVVSNSAPALDGASTTSVLKGFVSTPVLNGSCSAPVAQGVVPSVEGLSEYVLKSSDVIESLATLREISTRLRKPVERFVAGPAEAVKKRTPRKVVQPRVIPDSIIDIIARELGGTEEPPCENELLASACLNSGPADDTDGCLVVENDQGQPDRLCVDDDIEEDVRKSRRKRRGVNYAENQPDQEQLSTAEADDLETALLNSIRSIIAQQSPELIMKEMSLKTNSSPKKRKVDLNLDPEYVRKKQEEMRMRADMRQNSYKPTSTYARRRSKHSHDPNDPMLIEPLDLGWKRDLVRRSLPDISTNGRVYRRHDVYYWPPIGRKLRSSVDVEKYLVQHHITSLTKANFSYSDVALNHPSQHVRNAFFNFKHYYRMPKSQRKEVRKEVRELTGTELEEILKVANKVRLPRSRGKPKWTSKIYGETQECIDRIVNITVEFMLDHVELIRPYAFFDPYGDVTVPGMTSLDLDPMTFSSPLGFFPGIFQPAPFVPVPFDKQLTPLDIPILPDSVGLNNPWLGGLGPLSSPQKRCRPSKRKQLRTVEHDSSVQAIIDTLVTGGSSSALSPNDYSVQPISDTKIRVKKKRKLDVDSKSKMASSPAKMTLPRTKEKKAASEGYPAITGKQDGGSDSRMPIKDRTNSISRRPAPTVPKTPPKRLTDIIYQLADKFDVAPSKALPIVTQEFLFGPQVQQKQTESTIERSGTIGDGERTPPKKRRKVNVLGHDNSLKKNDENTKAPVPATAPTPAPAPHTTMNTKETVAETTTHSLKPVRKPVRRNVTVLESSILKTAVGQSQFPLTVLTVRSISSEPVLNQLPGVLTASEANDQLDQSFEKFREENDSYVIHSDHSYFSPKRATVAPAVGTNAQGVKRKRIYNPTILSDSLFSSDDDSLGAEPTVAENDRIKNAKEPKLSENAPPVNKFRLLPKPVGSLLSVSSPIQTPQRPFLNEDCMRVVFRHLETADLMRAKLVCRTWRRILLEPKYWNVVRLDGLQVTRWEKLLDLMNTMRTTHLDFRGLVLDARFRDLVHLTGRRPTRFPLSISKMTLGVFPIQSLADFITKLPANNIRVIDAQLLSPGSPAAPLANAGSAALLDLHAFVGLKQLERLTLSGLTGLKLCMFDLGPESLRDLQALRNLTVLSLTGVRTFDAAGAELEFVGGMTQLQTLELGNCTYWVKNAFTFIGKLVNLRRLRLEMISGYDSVVNTMASSVAQLHELEEIDLISVAMTANLGVVLRNLPKLRTIVLAPNTKTKAAQINTLTFNELIKLSQVKQLLWIVIKYDDYRGIPFTVNGADTLLEVRKMGAMLLESLKKCRVKLMSTTIDQPYTLRELRWR